VSQAPKYLVRYFVNLSNFGVRIMPKFDVLIVDKPTKKILANWQNVSRRRARWIAQTWRKKRIKGTSVCVSSRALLLPQRH
jgi:hypothetical protein